MREVRCPSGARPMTEATTILCRGLNDLHNQVPALGEQGYRIIAVIDSQNDLYTIVAQKDAFADYDKVMRDLGNVISNAVYEAGLDPK